MGIPRPFNRNSQDENRVLITAMDGFAGHVRAHFNPKEIKFDKSVGWQAHKSVGSNEPYYEFTGGEPRTMMMELPMREPTAEESEGEAWARRGGT